jgi:hypothetical protein
LKTTEKTQKWGRSVLESEIEEIWAKNGSPELGDLVSGRSLEVERRLKTEDGRRWRSHSGWVLAEDGERQWPFVVVLGTKKLVTVRRRTALVSNGRRNWKTAGDGRQPELEERRSWPELEERQSWPKMENDGGGSCLVVDSGKKMGRWRERGKNLGGSFEMKKMAKWV